MRIWLFVIFLAATTMVTSTAATAETAARILLVVSSHGRDEGRTRPGFEMDELSQAYAIFKSHGLEIDIASPDGGVTVADEYNAGKPYNAVFLADADAMSKLRSTVTTASRRAGDYAALFIIGGKGAMFDLPKDAALQKLVVDMDSGGAIIGAVCHGPAALVGIKRADGKPFAFGRTVTGFTNDEEAMFGEKWAKEFPFLLETALQSDGARFEKVDIMLPMVAVDGRLVTGQNPYSTSQTAEAVVKAMGRPVRPRELWPDERSMALAAKVASGESVWAAGQLANHKESYDVPLIAIWGYYRALAAGNDRVGLKTGLTVMELAQPYFPDPQLQSAIAETRAKLAAVSGKPRAM